MSTNHSEATTLHLIYFNIYSTSSLIVGSAIIGNLYLLIIPS
jgi:hypothetical protein